MKTFPVMNQSRSYRPIAGCPNSVPWPFVAAHEPQCLRNHWQTVERLAERGGLSPGELVAVLEDRRWRLMTDQEATERLRMLLDAWADDL